MCFVRLLRLFLINEGEKTDCLYIPSGQSGGGISVNWLKNGGWFHTLFPLPTLWSQALPQDLFPSRGFGSEGDQGANPVDAAYLDA